MTDSSREPAPTVVVGAVPVPDRMTGAELRVVREHLGLTTRWVAEQLDVQERTVHRWEAEVSPIPDGVRRQVEAWEADTAQVIDGAIGGLLDAAEPAVVTYRTDADLAAYEPDLGWPASWHRAMVGRVADEVPGLVIVWRKPAR